MRRNTRQSDIALYEAGAGLPFAGADAAVADGKQGESLFDLVNDRLSGRWRWTIMTAAALGLILALAGYFSAQPIYRSDGAIRITPRLPVILGETPEHRVDFFSQFVATQVHLIRGRRVLEHALENPELAALPWTKEQDVLETIQEELIIESDRNSELIGVSFQDPDPEVSQAVVNSVIRSYFDIYGKAEGVEVGRTLETLYEHREQLSRDMRAVRKDLARIHTRHEAADLRELQTMKLEKIGSLQERIDAAEFALAAKEESGPTGEDGLESTGGPTPRQLEMLDPKLADLRQMRDNAETEFRLVQDRYMPGTVPHQQAQRRLETTRALYDEQYATALELWRQYGAAALPEQHGGGDLEGYYSALSAPRLRQEITDLMTQAGAIREDLQQIILDIQELDDKEYEKNRIQADLDHTTERIQQLELNEASIVKRISIAQEGFRPRTPYEDSRIKRAVLGLAFGCMMSFGGFFLLGTVDKRTYGTRQLRQSLGEDIAGCLGVLPDLGQSIDSPESSEVAAHCVHQIRNQIEAIRDPRRGFVLAVSSPFQGDGKTSIVMALGWSYAAAGYNTLLIDCDLVGRSLSRQLGRLGEEGLKEALRDRQINGWISPLPVSNLSILPAGLDSRVGPHSLRRIDLDYLLTNVRATFDVIIVDTGPLLGSLESTPVAASADGVVLSVRRGRSRTRLEECRARLRAIGTHCVGVILNYAVRSDCHRYVSEASIAAAESHCHNDRESVVRTAQNERNVLMLAMEHTIQDRRAEEEPRRAAS